MLRSPTLGYNTNNQAAINPHRVDRCPFVCGGIICIYSEFYKNYSPRKGSL